MMQAEEQTFSVADEQEQEEHRGEEESESDAEDIPVAASAAIAAPSDGFNVGELVEAQDKAKTGWYSAKVLNLTEGGVKIHYMGWKARFDEVIPLDSGRLRRCAQSMVGAWLEREQPRLSDTLAAPAPAPASASALVWSRSDFDGRRPSMGDGW